MSDKIAQTWLPMYVGTRGYHVFNFYGHVGAGPKCPHAYKLNEKLLGDLFEYVATLGDTPILLLGDFQKNPADSHMLGSMLQTGAWHDLGSIFTNSEWTFQKDSEGKIRTRIDLAICNSIMLPHVRDVQILRDTGLPGHCPLQLKLDFPRELDHMQVYRLAAPLLGLQPARDERQGDIIENSIWNKRDIPFLSALKNGDIDSAFEIWSTAAEDYCLKLAESQDIAVPDGFATKHKDLHKMMLETWEPIFNRYSDRDPPQYDDFKQQFGGILDNNLPFSNTAPFDAPPFNEDIVYEHLHKLKISAPGADAWQVHELKCLGKRSLHNLAKLYNAIELHGIWPTCLLDVPVATIKKKTGESARDIRPISLASHIYRLWAGVRFKQLRPWMDSWIPDSLRGGVHGRDTTDIYYHLALDIEHSHSRNTLFGILFDFQKCFDNIPWSIEEGLLRDLGLPPQVSKSMYYFARHTRRRFKLGSSVGPVMKNTNSIMQGCPLDIIRINCLIAAWSDCISKNTSLPTCKLGAFVDDRSIRSTSVGELQQAIDVTEQFDAAMDAIIEHSKTVVFATSTAGRQQVEHLTYQQKALHSATDERLLGGHLSFTKRRARKLADHRANQYLQVARRATLCPLNIEAREILLSTAGAPKYHYGLELGPCSVSLERTLRTTIVNALWHKRSSRCIDVVLSICHRGHRFDPAQLRMIKPFQIARRQLLKHQDLRQLWQDIFAFTARKRASFRDGRTNAVGPLAIIQQAANSMQWTWAPPFCFEVPIGHNKTITFNILDNSDDYFFHILRLGASRALWARAATTRKDMKGIQIGVDKTTTLQLYGRKTYAQYNKGILRSIFAGAVSTQHSLYKSNQTNHPRCKFCWCADETIHHVFWQCPQWQHLRDEHLPGQLFQTTLQLPSCTMRTGLFLLTEQQSSHIVQQHEDPTVSRNWPTHHYAHAPKMQEMMVDIIKARNNTDAADPPDDFDPDIYKKTPKTKRESGHDSEQVAPKQPPAAAPDHRNPKTDDDGLLLSTSLRPGGSRFQYVQLKKSVYRAVIPRGSKRHSIGPFDTEEEAARAVKDFLERWDSGEAPFTRGSKREDKHTKHLQEELNKLNKTAKAEGRHQILDVNTPVCTFCDKSVQRYHILTFASRQCNHISEKAAPPASHEYGAADARLAAMIKLERMRATCKVCCPSASPIISSQFATIVLNNIKSGYVDDRNMRSTDLPQLRAAIHISQKFIKLLRPFIVARRQLQKHSYLTPMWQHIWHVTQSGSNWACQTHLLNLTDFFDDYFLHLLRWGTSSLLWRRASAARKDMRGIQQGVDKSTTLQVLNSNRLLSYDQGILRAILAGGVTTQVSKCHAGNAPHNACPFCWCASETVQHLFWECTHWQSTRLSFLTQQQLDLCKDLPPCTLRTGIFPLTIEQADAMVHLHSCRNLHARPSDLPPSPCPFAASIHSMMVAIVKARNAAAELPAPDNFVALRAFHDDEGLLLSQKRTHRFNTDLDAKLAALNKTSQKQARHHVASAEDPTCKWSLTLQNDVELHNKQAEHLKTLESTVQNNINNFRQEQAAMADVTILWSMAIFARFSQCTHTFIPIGIGTRGLHVFNIYGYVGAGPKNPHAFKRNEQLLDSILQCAASLGDVPILICGDLQTSPSESPALGSMVQSGRLFDLGHLYTDSAWTYQKGDNIHIRTRIDLMLANDALLPHVVNLEVLRDSGIPQHCPLHLSLDFQLHVDTKMVYKLPAPLLGLLPSTDDEVVHKLERSVWDAADTNFWSAIENQDVNLACDIWSTSSEQFCLKLAMQQGLDFRRKHTGRGKFPRVAQVSLHAPPSTPEDGAASIRTASILKLRRRVAQVRCKFISMPLHGSPAHVQLVSLYNNVKSSWHRLFGSHIPPLEDLHSSIDDLCQQLTVEYNHVQKEVADHRIHTFKQRMIHDWNNTRKDSYNWLRNNNCFTTPCFQTAPSEFATIHRRLHELMLEAWRPIFNRYEGRAPPDYTQFLNMFPDALPSDASFDALRPFQIPVTDEHIIKFVIQQLSPCAGGVDGWQVHEMKALGPLCIQRLVQLYRLVESTNTWPDNLCEIPVAALKKEGGFSPLDRRPISLSPLLYRVWAKAKFQQLQSWHVSWLPDVLRGGAPQREAIDCYYQVALEAEMAQISNHTLFGVFYDYKKCFDNIAWEIESGLLHDLGMPASVHGPMLAFSKQIMRRFKFGNSVGPAFPNTNSIMQGCPLAVLRINAVVAAWVRSLSSHPSTSLCALGGYIDDKNVRAQSVEQLQQVVDLTSAFNDKIDAVVNTDKTVIFATSAKGRKQLPNVVLGGQPLHQITDDKLVGGHLSFTKRRSRAIANKRARKYLTVAERLLEVEGTGYAITLASASADLMTKAVEAIFFARPFTTFASVSIAWMKESAKAVLQVGRLIHVHSAATGVFLAGASEFESFLGITSNAPLAMLAPQTPKISVAVDVEIGQVDALMQQEIDKNPRLAFKQIVQAAISEHVVRETYAVHSRLSTLHGLVKVPAAQLANVLKRSGPDGIFTKENGTTATAVATGLRDWGWVTIPVKSWPLAASNCVWLVGTADTTVTIVKDGARPPSAPTVGSVEAEDPLQVNDPWARFKRDQVASVSPSFQPPTPKTPPPAPPKVQAVVESHIVDAETRLTAHVDGLMQTLRQEVSQQINAMRAECSNTTVSERIQSIRQAFDQECEKSRAAQTVVEQQLKETAAYVKKLASGFVEQVQELKQQQKGMEERLIEATSASAKASPAGKAPRSVFAAVSLVAYPLPGASLVCVAFSHFCVLSHLLLLR
ncbi:unnamed protein product [Symbiodinium sp. CCMP2592]|nr:unnamed protein product [Symbiodinium sp. CCMP2592]